MTSAGWDELQRGFVSLLSSATVQHFAWDLPRGDRCSPGGEDGNQLFAVTVFSSWLSLEVGWLLPVQVKLPLSVCFKKAGPERKALNSLLQY